MNRLSLPYLIAAVIVGLAIACTSDGGSSAPGPVGNKTASDIDPSEIYTVIDRDFILSIDTPQFDTIEQAAEGMRPGEFVIGVSLHGQHRSYPINVLSVHEIVNDKVGDTAIAVTW